MYGKIFSSMYDGTLATVGPWQALATFQQLIVLSDQHGVVDMTPESIARRTTFPLDVIQRGIEALEQPDPHSRTPDEEGRRIVRLSDARPWGWRIVNYQHYRAIRSAEDRREYMKAYQREYRKQCKPRKPPINTCKQNKPIAEAEAEANKSFSPKKKKTGWPKNFKLTEERKIKAETYWKKNGVSFDVQLKWDGFKSNHTSKGSMFKDWDDAWETWYVKAVEFSSHGNGNSHTGKQPDGSIRVAL